MNPAQSVAPLLAQLPDQELEALIGSWLKMRRRTVALSFNGVPLLVERNALIQLAAITLATGVLLRHPIIPRKP